MSPLDRSWRRHCLAVSITAVGHYCPLASSRVYRCTDYRGKCVNNLPCPESLQESERPRTYDLLILSQYVEPLLHRKEEMILACRKIEVSMILGISLIELLIFGTVCQML